MTGHARAAWSWIQANRHRFVADVNEPWVVSAPDIEINDFLCRSYAHGADYVNIRDHLMFNFNSAKDMALFMKQNFVTNFALFGNEYLNNSVRR
jgi:hypothetical protein